MPNPFNQADHEDAARDRVTAEQAVTYKQILIRLGEEWHEWRMFPGQQPEYRGVAPIFVLNDDPENRVCWQISTVRI